MVKIPSERIRENDLIDMGLVLGRCENFIKERLSRASLTDEKEKCANTLLEENFYLRMEIARLRVGIGRYWIEFYGIPEAYRAMYESMRDHPTLVPQEKLPIMRHIDEHMLRCRTQLPNGIGSDLLLRPAFEPL